MTSTFLQRGNLLSAPTELGLPSPPDDVERDSYLQSQHRWIPLASTFGAFLTTVSLLFLVKSQLWAIPLLVPLAISTVGMFVALISSVQTRRDSLDSHRLLVSRYEPKRVPSIDVFLPSAGEELPVLHNTFWHVSKLEWDGVLTVWVLDDSGRQEVRELAEAFGFTYRVRENRGFLKKAGNLRFGYEMSHGDFIAIFDADFVPRSDYLRQLMPYTADETIAIVQSPQYFDTSNDMNWLQYAAGATQILFYRWIQASRDKTNAAICVGTCAIYRRSGLDAAGGFAQIGHSEDVHTGVNLMRAGYRTRYVPIVVSKGLCPDTLNQFANQQYRWCTGSMSLLVSKSFHQSKLSKRQRLCFWSGFLYYLDTAINVYVISIPPIFMALLSPEDVTIKNYLFVFVAMVVRFALVPVITMGRESMIGLNRIQSMYSFAHSLALLDVIRGRTDAWQATGIKTKSTTAKRVNRTMSTWVILVQALMWGGILWRAPEYGWINFTPMIAFAILNLLIVYPLMLWRVDFAPIFDPMSLRRTFSGLLS